MWKLLRNLVLVIVLMAGILKLLAWYAVGHDAPRVLGQLAPFVQLKYASLSTDLNGRITFENVQARPAATHRRFHADRVTFSGPNLLWLIKHSLFHENYLPDDFTIRADGVSLPAPLPWLRRPWMDPHTFVLFPDAGCNGAALGRNDYRKMGLPSRQNHAQFDYRYDFAGHRLDVALTVAAPGFSRVTAQAEIRQFDPDQLAQAGLARDLRIEQASADYADLGYMKRRARYCAARAGLSVSQFTDNHVAAATALLRQHQINPSPELIALYRHLAQQGGTVNALSLPTKGFVLGSWNETGAEAIWRQLNVTARYKSSPPIMFGLEFESPPPAQPATTIASAAQIVSVPPAVIAPATPTIRVPAPERMVRDMSAPTITSTQVLVREPPAVAAVRPTAATEGDRAARTGSAAPPVATSPAANEQLYPILPSSPRPPPDSTLALVWKPTIEPLPPATPLRRDYTVIPFSRLRHEIGRKIRLVTEGGNKVEGYVVRVDEDSVRLRVDRGGGDAQFDLRRSRIRQVQLLRK